MSDEAEDDLSTDDDATKLPDNQEPTVRHWMETPGRIATALFHSLGAVLIAIVMLGLAVTVFNATRAHGLVIEAFVVPEDVNKNGHSGQVVASEIRDRLRAMQKASERPEDARSITVVPPDDPIKVQVSQAGVSIEETSAYLNQWLSDQQHVSGEIVGDEGSQSITARVEGDVQAPCSVTGPDLESDIDQLAVCIYQKVDRFHYAAFLERAGRRSQALDLYRSIADQSPSRTDRAWAYRELGFLGEDQDIRVALADMDKAIELSPNFALAYRDRIDLETALGDSESAWKDTQILNQLIAAGAKDLTLTATRFLRGQYASQLADDSGDFTAAAQLSHAASFIPSETWYVQRVLEDEADSRAAAHDAKGLLTALQRLAELPDLPDLETRIQVATELQDWDEVVALGDGQCDWSKKGDIACATELCAEPGIQSCARLALAYAEASLRRSPYDAAIMDGKAIAMMAQTVGCYPCLVDEGKIDRDVFKDRIRARKVLNEAIGMARDLPFAYTERARLSLEERNVQGAILDLNLAYMHSPHYAESLELWGEALERRCDLEGASAKLDEAARSAPGWGKLAALRDTVRWAWRQQVDGKTFTHCERLVPVSVDEFNNVTAPRCGEALSAQSRISVPQQVIDEVAGINLVIAAETGPDRGTRRALDEMRCADALLTPPASLEARPSDVLGHSPRTLLSIARMTQSLSGSGHAAISEWADAEDSYVAMMDGTQLWRSLNPAARMDIATRFTNALDDAAEELLRENDGSDAARLWEGAEKYERTTTKFKLEWGEALDQNQDHAGALLKYWEAFRSDVGDRKDLGEFILTKSAALALDDEARGCFVNADSIYETAVNSGAARGPALADILVGWAQVLDIEGRSEEANEKRAAASSMTKASGALNGTGEASAKAIAAGQQHQCR